jgi:hypothetical protein
MFRFVEDNTEVLLIFGIGLGNYINYVSKKYKNITKIFLIEPSKEIFKKFLELNDLYDVISKFKEVTFIINKNETEAASIILPLINDTIKSRFDLVYTLSYRSLFEGYFEVLHNKIIDHIRSYRTNNATSENFKYRWLINTIRNINRQEMPIENLFDSFNKHAAVIVSAGPSLNKNIALLKNAANKAVIFAVGSGIKILNSNEIVPHFRVSIEGHNEQMKIFESIDTSICPLIHSTQSFYGVLQAYQSEKIRIVLDSDFLTQYIYDKAGVQYTKIVSGSSVANVTLDIICKMGFDKVIFVGQDLCYTEGELYAKGSWKEEKLSESNVDSLSYIKKKDIFGQDVYTTVPFLNMKRSFEERIKQNKNIEFINASEGGLGIEGTEVKSLEKSLSELPVNRKDIAGFLDEEKGVLEINEYVSKISNVILQIESEIIDIIALNDKRISYIQEILNNTKNRKRVLESIKFIEEFDEKLKGFNLYVGAIEPALIRTFSAIYLSFRYTGEDEYLRSKAILKTSLNEAVELREYVYLFKGLIEEYKGERKLNIAYN